MKKLFKLYYFLFLFSILSCRSGKIDKNIDKVILCALQELFDDINFQEHFVQCNTYFAWIEDGYMSYDSVETHAEYVAWEELEYIEVDEKEIMKLLNTRFPKEHQLVPISKEDGEHKLRYEKKEIFSAWYFGGFKKSGNRYFLKGGYAMSTRVGTGAFFIIDIINRECEIVEYHPAIF